VAPVTVLPAWDVAVLDMGLPAWDAVPVVAPVRVLPAWDVAVLDTDLPAWDAVPVVAPVPVLPARARRDAVPGLMTGRSRMPLAPVPD